jgi:hypothetical protein
MTIGALTWLDLLNLCATVLTGLGAFVLAWQRWSTKLAVTPFWSAIKNVGMGVFFTRFAAAYGLAHYYGLGNPKGNLALIILQSDWVVAATTLGVLVPVFVCIVRIGIRVKVLEAKGITPPPPVEGR